MLSVCGVFAVIYHTTYTWGNTNMYITFHFFVDKADAENWMGLILVQA